MRTLLFLSILLFAACNSHEPKPTTPSKQDTLAKMDTAKHPSQNWQDGLGLTHIPEKDSVAGHAVRYYLDDPDCSGLARDFYYGLQEPSDNGSTEELLKLVTTDNKRLRPFYRWCLNTTIQIQDGALAEMTGIPARHYAEKYPEEFFAYMDSDTSGGRYSDWTEAIQYSGFEEQDDYHKPGAIRKRMIQEMQKHANGSHPSKLKRINQFAADCFPDGLGE